VTSAPAPVPYPLRPISADELPTYLAAIEVAFGEPGSPEYREAAAATVELDRTIAAYDGGRIVATAAAYSLAMTVPGGATHPVAAVTDVSVAPTHRRRGLLTALMRAQLADVADRGREAFAALWATEPQIYQRFGYGLAAWRSRVEVDLAHAGYSPAGAATLGRFGGRLRLLERGDAEAPLAAVHAAAVPGRAGMLQRPPPHWDRLLRDYPEDRPDGTTPLQFVVAEAPTGEPAGYALYRLRARSDGGFSHAGDVRVQEITALEPPGYAALWRYLLDLDLMDVLVAANRPVPDPVAHLLADHRRLHATLGESLWVRLVDLPRALSERCYAAPVDVVLGVEDPVLPGNTGNWRVRVDAAGGPADVERTAAEPDLLLAAADLGAAHLGGISLGELGLAGRVLERRAGALAATSRAWSWQPSPHCPEVF